MQRNLQFPVVPARLAHWGTRCLLALGLLASAPIAEAQTILGLGTITGPNLRGAPVGSQGLIIISPTNGAANTLVPLAITGVTAGQTLIGIDYRPIDNLLYALGYDGVTAGNNAQLYLLNAGTNVATPVGSAIRLELGGPAERISFDFNPTVDRIRVMSSNDANYRLNPITGAIAVTDGTLAYAATDANAGLNPGVGAAAYTNSTVGAATTTTLYDFDYLNNGLLSIQNPPNAGTLNTQSTVLFKITGGSSPGTYPIGQPNAIGLDIYFDPANNTNVGYVTEVTAPRTNGARASNTYRLDLSTGLATQLGNTVPASQLFNFEIRDLAVTLAAPVLITWNGSVSTDWRTAANWTPAFVPSALNDVLIPGGTPFQPIVSTNQQTRAITLTTGALLTTADGSNLVVGGDFTNNGGTLDGAGSGTVILNLNTVQTIGGTSPTTFQNLTVGVNTVTTPPAARLTAPVSVRRLLGLVGDLNVNGQVFTLLSDANNTAQVINAGGVVVGNATVQRYIEPSLNPGPGYRHYSSPVANSTVADLSTPGFTPVVNPAYNTVGTGVRPFPTVFGYDETRVNTSGNPAPQDFDKGFFSPGSLNDGLEVTRGYTVNIPGTETVDFVGDLNNGSLTASNLTRGNQTTSGYHLRGNPYPSPLDWQLMTDNGRLTGIDRAVYVFKSSGQYTGSYSSYNNGVSVNGGTRFLPLGQGFFVRTSTPGVAGSIAFTNAERLTTYNNTPFQRGTADSRPQLTLTLRSTSAANQTAVYFEQGATAGFDAAFDANYLPASNGLELATATSPTAAEALAINGQPLLTGTDVLLPLRLSAFTAGPYALTVDNLANLPTGYHAYLRDALTGSYTDLATTPTVSLNLTAGPAAAGRYALLFTTQSRVLATAPAALARLASVYPNPAHGAATLLLPVALRGTQATTVSVVDNLGRTVLTRTLAAGAVEALELPLSGLAPGIYSVQARTAAGLVVKRLAVE